MNRLLIALLVLLPWAAFPQTAILRSYYTTNTTPTVDASISNATKSAQSILNSLGSTAVPNATRASYVNGTITNNTTGNAATATAASTATSAGTAIVSSYVAGTLSNNITGNAATATTASYVSGTLTNNTTGNSATSTLATNAQALIGTLPYSQLGFSGVRNGTFFLRDDLVWSLPAGSNAMTATNAIERVGGFGTNTTLHAAEIFGDQYETNFVKVETGKTSIGDAGGAVVVIGGNITASNVTANIIGPLTNNTTGNAATATVSQFVSGTLTNSITGNASTATSATSATTATTSSYVTGTLSNSITGNAATATVASFVSGALSNNITGNAATASSVSGTLTNNTTGNASTATVASYVSGTLSNNITGNANSSTSAGSAVTANTATTASYVTGTLTNDINDSWIQVSNDARGVFNADYGTITITPANAANGQLSLGYDKNLGANGSGWIQSVKSGTAYTPLLLNPNAGNVGIGISTPSEPDKVTIVQTSSSASQSGLFVNNTGAQPNYGYGVYVSKTGAGGANVGGLFAASGGGANYGLLVTSGNVGIGTNAPELKLHVYGGAGSSGQLLIGEGLEANERGMVVGYDYNNDYAWIQSTHQNTAYTPLNFQPNGGRVGIGTTNPSTALHVVGDVTANGDLHLSGSVTPSIKVGTTDSDSRLFVDFPNITAASSAKVQLFRNTSTGNGYLDILKGDGTAAQQHQFSSFASSYVQNLIGNFGVGTNNPQTKLHVNGDVTANNFIGNGTATFGPNFSVDTVGWTVRSNAHLSAFPPQVFGKLGTTTRIKVLVLGDSMSGKYAYGFPSASDQLEELLDRLYGRSGHGADGWHLGASDARVWNTADSVDHWVNDVTAAITPGYGVLAQQGVWNSVTNNINLVGVFWLSWTNGGNFTVRHQSATTAEDTTWTLNGKSSSPTFHYTNWPVGLANDHTMLCSSSAGTNLLIGPEFANTNSGGFEFFYMSRGSATLDMMTNSGIANIAAFGAAINPDLIVYHAKDSTEGTEGAISNNIVAVLNACRGGSTSNTVIIIGTPPWSVAPGIAEVQNALMRRVCTANAYTYVDLYNAFPSYAEMAADGLITDGTHPTLYGAKAWAAKIYQEMFLPPPAPTAPTPAVDLSPYLTDFPPFYPHFYNGFLVGLTNNAAVGQLWLGAFGSGGVPAIWTWNQPGAQSMVVFDLGIQANDGYWWRGRQEDSFPSLMTLSTNGAKFFGQVTNAQNTYFGTSQQAKIGSTGNIETTGIYYGNGSGITNIPGLNASQHSLLVSTNGERTLYSTNDVLLVTTTSGITVHMPLTNTLTAGKEITIKNSSGGSITVVVEFAGKIDDPWGAADTSSVTMTNTTAATWVYDGGVSWKVVSEYPVSGNATIAAQTITGTNLFTSAPSNAIAPSTVSQPIGLFGSMMMDFTNTVTTASTATYYGVTNYSTIRTNGFLANAATGYLTNTVAGFYSIRYYLCCYPPGADTLEAEVEVNGVGREEISDFHTYANPPRVDTRNACGILYLPANASVRLNVRDQSSTGVVTIWRGALNIGTP